MRFLVTGAGGFIGSRLCRHLSALGHQVVGTTQAADPESLPFPATRVDLLDMPAVARAIEAAAPDAIVHLAGLSHVRSSWEQIGDYFRVNVLGTRHVLAAAGENRVVLASSGEVYGLVPEEEQPITESAPVDPRNPYAMSKAAAELLALDRGAVVVRSFNLIGPGQSATFALASFARQLAAISRGEVEPVLHVGNLDNRRDFLHVDDSLEAFRLLAAEGVAGECYNLASGEAHSVSELLDLLVAVSGVEARVEVDPDRCRPIDVPLTSGDAGKLRALGWAPRLTIEDALRDLWRSVV